jgi:hypothetical protein
MSGIEEFLDALLSSKDKVRNEAERALSEAKQDPVGVRITGNIVPTAEVSAKLSPPWVWRLKLIHLIRDVSKGCNDTTNDYLLYSFRISHPFVPKEKSIVK